jgi:hypothetical protein
MIPSNKLSIKDELPHVPKAVALACGIKIAILSIALSKSFRD